jgi:hypothetical protein
MAASKIDQVVAALRTAEQEATHPHGKGDGTADRIHRETGISPQNIRKHLDTLFNDGKAHIFCWTDNFVRAPVWVLGPGEHAPEPQPMSKEEARSRGMLGQLKERTVDRDVREPGWAKVETYAYIERVRHAPQSWCSPLMEAV